MVDLDLLADGKVLKSLSHTLTGDGFIDSGFQVSPLSDPKVRPQTTANIFESPNDQIGGSAVISSRLRKDGDKLHRA